MFKLLLFTFFTLSTQLPYAAAADKVLSNDFVVANIFWDEDKNFVINDTREYYHDSYVKSPFYLGDVFGDTWKITDARLKSTYQLPNLTTFGTYSTYYKDKFLYTIRTNQYYLGHKDDKPQFGIRFIPYSENSTKNLDEYIRARHGLKANDVFVAPSYYFHQEYFKGEALELEKSSRFDDGFTHMGAYIGGGQTRNAPYDYHDMKLQTQGYPANLTRVIYKGTEQQSEFQRNFYITLKLLNELNGGVKFSRLDYQQDYYEANNLKSIFDFYRAWLDPKWIRSKEDGKPFYEVILEDVKYDIYCSEHIAMILNVAINLVQTEAGYIRVFGKDSEQAKRGEVEQENKILKGGEYFWSLAQKRWTAEVKTPWPTVEDASITELWKIYNGHRSIQVTQINEVGRYLAWPPQTLTDLIANLMTLYARFDRVGKDVSLELLAKLKYLIAARVMFSKDKSKDFIKNSVSDFPMEKLDALVRPFEDLIKQYWGVARYKGPQQAYREFQAEAQKLVFQYRDPKKLRLKPDSFFYYATPHVIHRMIQGLHPYSKYLEFEILGTVLPQSDLELNNKEDKP